MASWAVLLALSGFHYSAVSRHLELAPRWKSEAFRCVWTIPSGWGTVKQIIEPGEQVVRWEVLSGELVVETMRYALPQGARLRTVGLEPAGLATVVQVEQKDGFVAIGLSQMLTVTAGRGLVVRMELD